MIRVLVADDHELIREGLRKIFSREPDIELVATVRNAAEAMAAVREFGPDVAVLDFSMPGRSGLETIAPLKALQPGLAVLILSFMPESDLAVRTLKAGGAGFISKDSAGNEIVTAVRRAAAGQKYISPATAEQLATAVTRPGDAHPHDSLSPRELQVLRQIAAGLSTRDIAAAMSLSVNTVATYRRRLREKLGVDSDVALARYALENRLVP